MRFNKELYIAYCAARYSVFTPSCVINLWHGSVSEGIAALHESYEVQTSSIITACNPYSKLTSATENNIRQERLARQVSCRWKHLPAAGTDPQGCWPPEPGILILGITRDEARMLARDYDQHAILYIEGATPRVCASDINFRGIIQ